MGAATYNVGVVGYGFVHLPFQLMVFNAIARIS